MECDFCLSLTSNCFELGEHIPTFWIAFRAVTRTHDNKHNQLMNCMQCATNIIRTISFLFNSNYVFCFHWCGLARALRFSYFFIKFYHSETINKRMIEIDEIPTFFEMCLSFFHYSNFSRPFNFFSSCRAFCYV